jgi:hypothetical protein
MLHLRFGTEKISQPSRFYALYPGSVIFFGFGGVHRRRPKKLTQVVTTAVGAERSCGGVY